MADGPSGGFVIESLNVRELGQLGGETGSLKDSTAADIKCDGRIACKIGTTVYYIPVYDTTV